MTRIMFALALSATTVLFAQNAFAQNGGGTPSSKATAAISTAVTCTFKQASSATDTVPVTECHDVFTGAAVGVDAADNTWVSIMSATIKVSNSQSLFVSPSLVTGLYTQTKTRTTTGSESTAVAEGGVYLRAKITNQATGAVQFAEPLASCGVDTLGCYDADGSGDFGVTLNTRIQSLTQALSECVIDVTSIIGTNDGSCTFESTIELILKTTSAHTFNMIFPQVGQGVYTVEIQGAVNAAASVSGLGSATGAAAYGLGSVTVESVRLVHDFEF